MTTTQDIPGTIRIGDAQYERPFCDNEGRPMVAVYYDDGDRFVTYYVGAEVFAAFGIKR